MSGPQYAGLRPFCLDGTRGRLIAFYYPPQGRPHPMGDLLYVPPFAEEMNRCRAMASMQAQALAQTGIGTLVVDLYGTGDSAGDFAGGTWELWRDDLARGLAWLREHGNGCRALWGVRLGAVMAAELALQDTAIERLLLWQPVLNGKSFFTQFLRIRIAAELDQADGIKTTDELRGMAASGESIEVSGYRVSAELARAMDLVKMPEAAKLAALQLTWFEVLPGAESAIPRANSKAVDDFRAARVQVAFETVVGPPFWQVHEREVAPDLITATVRAAGAWVPRAPSSGETLRGGRTDAAPPAAGADAEFPLMLPCGPDQLSGVLHRGKQGAQRGVIVVVAGGPQYRVGAHRQFVSLARKLAAHGYPVLRFDLRGMGDSSGTHVGFEDSDPDIRAAIDTLLEQEPQLREVVLFGECASASSILFYAWRDPRVTGVALVNPWVRTQEGQAQVILKHYYLDRLRSREFWRGVRSGEFGLRRSLASLTSMVEVVGTYLRGRKSLSHAGVTMDRDDISGLPLPVRTAVGLKRFQGPVMILMSGRDLIAREFDEVTAASRAWDGLLQRPRLLRRDLMEADHTFSREAWKNKASDWVVEWIESW